MNRTEVIKHCEKRCLIILNILNSKGLPYKYTATIPFFEGECFSITDIFNKEVSIHCNTISTIIPVGEYNGKM